MKYYLGLEKQLQSVNDDLRKIYKVKNFSNSSPASIALARIIAEEREIKLKLSDIHLKESQELYIHMIAERFEREDRINQSGGETLPIPHPALNRLPIQRRQTKIKWCYATAALMYSLDSGYITKNNLDKISKYKSIFYKKDSKLRYKYCGYDVKEDKYYCNPGQEYVVILCGDDPKSCLPGNVLKAVSLLTNKKVRSIGNNYNNYWINSDGSLNLERQKKLSQILKVPAICDTFKYGDPYTEKGHSLLILDFKYEDGKVVLYTEDCVYGEKPIILDFSCNINCSVYSFLTKVTNIYFIE